MRKAEEEARRKVLADLLPPTIRTLHNYWPCKCLKFVIIILMIWHKQGYEERSRTVCVSTVFRTPRQSVLAHTVEEPHVLAHTARGAPKI